MSHVNNQKAIDSTSETLFAIFISRMNNRYAVNRDGIGYKTYIETHGRWERCENLANFCVWNCEFQGFDDITSLIVE